MADEVYAVLYLRPDGWWEAGRGWDDREHAERDAREQIPNKSFERGSLKVVPVAEIDSYLCEEAKAE